MRIAYIFPGQGSQAIGMGKDLFDNFAAAREVFAAADDALGFPLSEMCFSGSEEDLAMTANTQPAILTTSVAAFRAMKGEGFDDPDFAAGHSLGEYSALVAAGVLDFADAVRTVRKRGTYMQEAVPVGVGAMAAILGADVDTVETACAEAADGQVCSPANINSPSQIVIAGDADAVDRACELLKERGAKRAIKLNVSAPFHCTLMEPAAEKLGVDLDNLEYREFRFPIVTNLNAELNEDPGGVNNDLWRQVWSPVKWLQSVRKLRSLGVETFVEIGPGKVLSGLVRQIDRDVRCLNVDNAESLRNTRETL
ncbi:MAG TPA: ACP S-malonyltransferase [Pyrinomonadaceae bacterium]|nr:ACP S-malonyltransferase [Chloracidobacterium sp.]HBE83599.1 [acyl-carrier-protein] S-malonyltransferase [Blastocatellia bacterium]HRJ89130.1 ACP S-malonyltransferase [Pyrinomonadaceae bacterium]HRK50159.1 ACP S-malonyltransferase [Pyrinomonadaceae bacterium]